MRNRILFSGLVWMLLFAALAYAQYDWLMANGNRELSAFVRNEKILQPPFEIVNDVALSAKYMAIDGHYMGVTWDKYPSPNIAELVDLASATVLWSYEIPGTSGVAAVIPALSESLLFCSGYHSTSLYALQRATGAVKWEKSFSEPIYHKHPILDGPRLYYINDSLYCFEAATGVVIWKQKLSWSQMTPAVDDSTVYAVSRPMAGKICWAFNKFTGAKKWEVENDGFYLLTVDRRYLYVLDGSNVVARDKRSGKIARTWTLPPNYAMDAMFPSAGALSDDYLCLCLTDTLLEKGHMVTVRLADFTMAWDHESTYKYGFFTPAIANGVVYAAEAYGSLWGLELASGNVVFHDTTVSCSSAPIIANHALYIMTGGSLRMYANPKTGVDEKPVILPEQISLAQNYPNPFNASTRMTFHLPRREHVNLTVFNLRGQAVAELANGELQAGAHSVTWPAEACESGIYFIRLSAPGIRLMQKATLIK